MNHKETVAVLKSAGTAQNRKTYGRHGVTRKMYGVSFAELGKLQKRIKCDQALAESLWATGNHDACILGLMVLDPETTKSSQWDAWVKELDSYVIADTFSKALAQSPHAEAKMKKWMKSRADYVAQVGWNLLAYAALADDGRPNAWFEPYLKTIEEKIHTAPNRARYSMNNALIAIGTRSKALHKKAVAAAKRIGKVEVDHGETGCQTPSAIPYMQKTWARKDAKKKG